MFYRFISKTCLDVADDTSNVTRQLNNEYGNFVIKESLFAGPSGKFAKLQTTWQVMADGSLRFITLIAYGG